MRILSIGALFAVITFALLGPSAAIESTGATSSAAGTSIHITVRDSLTGLPVPGSVSALEAATKARRSVRVRNGRVQLSLAEGRNDLNIEAEGYREINTFAHVEGDPLDMTIWLDRAEPFAADVHAGSGQTVITGNVIDKSTMEPLVGARVWLTSSSSAAITDGQGTFSIVAAAAPVDPRGDIPGTDDLNVEYEGKLVYRRNGLLMTVGSKRLIVDVEYSGGLTTTEDSHKLIESRNAVLKGSVPAPQQAEVPQEVEGRRSTATIPPAVNQSSAISAVPVPNSIRVGFSCAKGKLVCESVQVFTLDNYTRLGLDDEWFSSWHTNSLKAGAIANRSYAVWHIANPLTSTYDICNTTSCQVIDPNDSAASTDLATAQTTGTIVVNSSGNGPFFAEYSAENNLGGCPDGFTGNNTTWPCLADPVDAGRAFNGHGRGMCQWGTQNWAKATEQGQGKDYVWIVNHYYNANGNPSGLRTGILQLSPNSVLPPPELASPAGPAAPGIEVKSLTPTLQWQPVSGSDGYGVYISKFNGTTYDLIYNSETAMGQPITGTSFTLPTGLLQQNGQYRWNMSAHNTAGYGTSSTFRGYFFVNASATVAGRVFTADGRPLRGASVSIVDPDGAVRSVATSSLGFYSFDDGVQPGKSYTLRVSSKRYRYESQQVKVDNSVSDLDFYGQE